MTGVALPPDLQAIFEALVAAHPDGLTLDELSEELLHKPVGYAEIDLLIGALEEAGFDLLQDPERVPPPPRSGSSGQSPPPPTRDLEGQATPTRPEQLMQVLTAARELTAELGRRPTAAEIAGRTGLTAVAVLRALRFGKTIGA